VRVETIRRQIKTSVGSGGGGGTGRHVAGSCGGDVSGGGSGLAFAIMCRGMENGKGKEGNRKGIRWFLNTLMLVGCHITDDHKWTAPRVPGLLMFVGSAMSPMNISG
jgi:hypothetical protein